MEIATNISDFTQREKDFIFENMYDIEKKNKAYGKNYVIDLINIRRICEHKQLMNIITNTSNTFFINVHELVSVYIKHTQPTMPIGTNTLEQEINNYYNTVYTECFGDKYISMINKMDTDISMIDKMDKLILLFNFIVSNRGKQVLNYLFIHIDDKNKDGTPLFDDDQYDKKQIEYLTLEIISYYRQPFKQLQQKIFETIFIPYYKSCLLYKGFLATRYEVGFNCVGESNKEYIYYKELFSIKDYELCGRNGQNITDIGIITRIQTIDSNIYLGGGYSGSTELFITLASLFKYKIKYNLYCCNIVLCSLFLNLPWHHTMNELIKIAQFSKTYEGLLYNNVDNPIEYTITTTLNQFPQI